MDFTFETTITIPVKVKVYGYTSGKPGRFSGPPEKCYPDEPAEWSHLEYFIEVERGGKKQLIKLPTEIDNVIEEELDDEIIETGETNIEIDAENAAYDRAETRRERLEEMFRELYP